MKRGQLNIFNAQVHVVVLTVVVKSFLFDGHYPAFEQIQYHTNRYKSEDSLFSVIRDYDNHCYFRAWGDSILAGAFEETAKPIFHDGIPDDFNCSTTRLPEDWDHLRTHGIYCAPYFLSVYTLYILRYINFYPIVVVLYLTRFAHLNVQTS